MARYLPHAVVATTFVIVLPTLGVWQIVPSGSPMLSILSVVVAVVMSVAAASAASAFWTRRPGSRDVVFADLMLWGWLRRLRAERRLAEARKVLGLAPSGDDLGPDGVHRRVAALTRLSTLLEARDAGTHGHTRRVTRHAERIARAMRLPPAEVAKVRTAAALHDVGKIHTPPEILNKPGQLTAHEFEVIKRHPVDGADMLTGIGDPDVSAMVRHHHERLDGAGYPDGLAGEQIPLGARIIAVADTFDAMTSNRAYHGATNHKRALDVLSEEAGARLDAAAVSAFLEYYSGRTSVAWSALVTAVPQRLVGWLGSATERVGSGAASIAHALPAAGAALLLTAPMPGGGPAVRVGSAEARQQAAAGQADRSRLAAVTPGGREARPDSPRRGASNVPGDEPSRGVRRAPAGPDARPPASSPVAEPRGSAGAPSEQPAPDASPAPVHPGGNPSPGSDPDPPPGARPPEGALPPVTLPPVKIPPLEIPPLEIPPLEIPPLEIPPLEIPALEIPGLEIPAVNLPPVQLPTTVLPRVDVPPIDVPGVALDVR